jgi:hypothetical protein
MNARTEVDRHVGQGQWSPTVGTIPQSHDGTELAESTMAVANPRRSMAADEPRLSVDPMHATDRYRLVVPYTLRV